MSEETQRVDNHGCGGNAAPYVLGALTPAEHEAFAEHLSSCAVCREEVASLQMVAASLPATAPQLSAPRKLKRRVMSEVRADARADRPGSAASARAALTSAKRRPLLAGLALGAAAVAAALAFVIAGGSGSSGSGSRVIRAQVSPAGSSASLLTSHGHAQLTLTNMPQARAGRVYEVWVERSGPPAPTDALFTVSSHGSATVAVPGAIAGVTAVLVTSEPLGGSRVPTSAPVIIAKLA
jgi:anti-sigma-K factor RskA